MSDIPIFVYAKVLPLYMSSQCPPNIPPPGLLWRYEVVRHLPQPLLVECLLTSRSPLPSPRTSKHTAVSVILLALLTLEVPFVSLDTTTDATCIIARSRLIRTRATTQLPMLFATILLSISLVCLCHTDCMSDDKKQSCEMNDINVEHIFTPWTAVGCSREAHGYNSSSIELQQVFTVVQRLL